MSTLRDIRRRIRSVRSTQQITKAMEMVAAAKLRKAQARAERARRYAEKMDLILANLSRAVQGQTPPHPCFAVRPVRRTTLVLITADRGLCGSFNANLIRRANLFLRDYTPANVELVIIGKRGYNWFRHHAFPIVAQHLDFGGNMDFTRARRIATDLEQRFAGEQTDAVFLLGARFKTTARCEITLTPFLPIAGEPKPGIAPTDYIFEPAPEAIFSSLTPRYLATVIRTVLAESFASEHAARMLAMGVATKSAGEMIDTLTLQYNKARQAAITRELIDIVGGAEALR